MAGISVKGREWLQQLNKLCTFLIRKHKLSPNNFTKWPKSWHKCCLYWENHFLCDAALWRVSCQRLPEDYVFDLLMNWGVRNLLTSQTTVKTLCCYESEWRPAMSDLYTVGGRGCLICWDMLNFICTSACEWTGHSRDCGKLTKDMLYILFVRNQTCPWKMSIKHVHGVIMTWPAVREQTEGEDRSQHWYIN